MIGDRIFVNNASLGAYATVAQPEEYRAAKMSTAVQMLPDPLTVAAVAGQHTGQASEAARREVA